MHLSTVVANKSIIIDEKTSKRHENALRIKEYNVGRGCCSAAQHLAGKCKAQSLILGKKKENSETELVN